MELRSEITGAFDTLPEREELIRTILGGIIVAVILYVLIRVAGVKVR